MLKVKAIYVEMKDMERKIWSTDFYGESASKDALTEVKACITVRKWKLYHVTPILEKVK